MEILVEATYFNPDKYPEGLASFVAAKGVVGWVYVLVEVVEPDGGSDGYGNPVCVDAVAIFGVAEGCGVVRDDGYFYFADNPLEDHRELHRSLNNDVALRLNVMAIRKDAPERYAAAPVIDCRSKSELEEGASAHVQVHGFGRCGDARCGSIGFVVLGDEALDLRQGGRDR